MNDRGLTRRLLAGGAVCVLSLLLLAGCSTTKIDWASRIGVYTYDQAVADFGPPDKEAKLKDGTVVAEWLAYRAYSHVPHPWPYYSYYGCRYYPYYAPIYYYDSYPAYERYLRLTFNPEGKLVAWKYITR
jgi:hypothetical protein